MCHGAFSDDASRIRVRYTPISKLTLGKLIYVFERNPTDSSVDKYDDATPLSF